MSSPAAMSNASRGCFRERSVFLFIGRLQPAFVLNDLVGISRVVADPPAVDATVVTRLDAVHDAFVVLEEDVLSAGIDGGNGRCLLEEPNALLEKEILVQQGPHRAEIDHVARQLVVAGLAGKYVDFLAVPAAIDVQLAGPGNFAREAHATRAHDAAIRVEIDVVAHVFFGLFGLVFLEAGLAAAVFVGIIL